MFPGGTDQTMLVSSKACENPNHPCPSYPDQRLFNESASILSTAASSGPVDGGTFDHFAFQAFQNITGQGHYIQTPLSLPAEDSQNQGVCSGDTCVINYAGQFLSDNITITYAGGKKYSYTLDTGLVSSLDIVRPSPVPMCNQYAETNIAAIYKLSLVTPPSSQFEWTAAGGDQVTVNDTLAEGYQSGFYPSNSFGMHIGSVPHVNGSLWLGGYDQARSISTPITSSEEWFQLLDIGLGTAYGDSPFIGFVPGAGKSGLLQASNGNSPVSSINALPNLALPHMFLPAAACSAIVQYLPVTFDADLNLYLWNTDDSRYAAIMSSPSYLSFQFNGSTSSSTASNTTIFIPFALLNLNLSSPLASKPTAYFPCSPYTPDPSDFLALYHLGRAFMQGVFFAQSRTSPSVFSAFLAQAPGPSLPTTTILPIHGQVVQPLSQPPAWNETWKDVLNPWFSNSSSLGQPIPPVPDNRGGMATRTKVAIGISVVVGVLLLVLALLLGFWARKRKQTSVQHHLTTKKAPAEMEGHTEPASAWQTRRLPGEAEADGRALMEAPAFEAPKELHGSREMRYELAAG